MLGNPHLIFSDAFSDFGLRFPPVKSGKVCDSTSIFDIAQADAVLVEHESVERFFGLVFILFHPYFNSRQFGYMRRSPTPLATFDEIAGGCMHFQFARSKCAHRDDFALSASAHGFGERKKLDRIKMLTRLV